VSKLQATRPGGPEACERPQAAVKTPGKAGTTKSRPAARPAAKPAAKKAASAKKVAAKAHAKPTPSKPAKPDPKAAKPKAAPANSAAAKSVAAKPAAKAAHPAAKPAAKPAAAPSSSHPSPSSAPVSKASPTKTSTKPETAASKHASASASRGGNTAVATPPAARSTTRASAKAPAHMPLPAVSTSAEQASRFADRFSPAKPAPRVVIDAGAEAQKQVRKDPKLANAWKSKAGRDLSEEELMAMPDNEYMNDQQLDFFRKRLTQLKDDLLSNAEDTTEHLREDTSIVPDPADRATIEEEHALELRTRDRERKLLKKISQSLARIEGGDYGFCDETGEPIGIARLLARPTATLSLEAQQRRELKQKMFGD
jgi:DnaK suppressor protein